jgi:hypothetical protein
MSNTTKRMHEKIGFSTLAQALSARSSIARGRAGGFAACASTDCTAAGF